VDLAIYDLAGEPVLKESYDLPAGKNVLPWDGANASKARSASGVYLIKVHAKAEDGSEGSYWARAALLR
jgi:hypothetical protein